MFRSLRTALLTAGCILFFLSDHAAALPAVKISVDFIPAITAAGQTIYFSVYCLDILGGIDREWNGSTLTIEGMPGAAPGVSPSGAAPEYAGSGVWEKRDQGQRLCQFTLYKAEPGRRIRIRDSVLGNYDSDPIQVRSAGASHLTAGTWSQALRAGEEGRVTVTCNDAYGNPDASWTNSSLLVSGAPGAEPGTAPAGQQPVYGGSGAWQASEGGQRVCTYTLYRAEAGRKVRVADSSLGSVDSPGIAVSGGASKSMNVSGWVPSVTAGQRVPVTVSCSDIYGNIADVWTGSTLSVGPAAGFEAGASPSGREPEYTGSGPWSSADHGRRVCSYTLFKAESGRKVRISDNVLGTFDSDPISVAPAAVSGMHALPVPGQTAGIPFTVTITPSDDYGNPRAGYSGSVTRVIADSGITASPDGTAPVLPQAYLWSGLETAGQATLKATLFCVSDAARLKITDTGLSTTYSNLFSVAPGPAKKLALTGAAFANIHTPFTYLAAAVDAWGNQASSFTGRAAVSCTDADCVIPDSVSLENGTANVDVVFHTPGYHVITVLDRTGSVARGSLRVLVSDHPRVDHFSIALPEAATAGAPFNAVISALDGSNGLLSDYSNEVNLGTDGMARISPAVVMVKNGVWSGDLTISGEMAQARITIADEITVSTSQTTVRLAIPTLRDARAYPTVFDPGREPLRIRYYLREDRPVRITIYSVLMDPVRIMEFPAGAAGGREGVNVVEWNGRGGSGGNLGHSGGYHIFIEKGYENEWTGAVIKNY